MKYLIRALLTAVALATSAVAVRAVEATWNYAVQVSAKVQPSPASITLSWSQDTTSTPSSYTVHRKLAGASSWGPGTTLPGTATSYTDTSVTVGTAYEYQIVKVTSGYTGYGYIQAGINVPLVENRGKLVLVVDNTHAAALAAELARLEQDLAGDGWTVVRRDVARTDSAAAVKNQIKTIHAADPANVKAVFLFGHVAVPYSGQFNPDGHPDHIGAWPADVYYGDMDGNWTDSSVNYTQTLNTDPVDAARISNKPGDGKFDQTSMPSPVELQVGRVDLANMPGKTSWNSPATFPSELELLRQYLNKDHNFRHRKISVQRRAIVGDYFGIRNGEAFAASGYRSAAPLVGADKITNLNVLHNDQRGVWVPALAAGDYLFAYGCGAGSYRSIAGLGNTGNYNDANTVEMVKNDVHGVFNMLFGSWLGDWDHEDSMLRSVLATKTHGLTAVWSGRPHWFMHPMGLGETIGATAKIAQNNGNGLYKTQRNSNVGNVHVALMGDPTLRLHPVAPPASVGGTVSGSSVTLSWNASPEAVLGYHVYRAASPAGPFTRLTNTLLTSRTFTDSSAPTGATYMVRAVKLETSPSGTYYNASQGVFWKAGGAAPIASGDTTAPTITLTAPAAGVTVSGSSVAVSASASDNVGVAGVQFMLDGAALGAEDTAAPFSATWNSTAASNGSHALTAVARDAAGNRKTSAAVTVNVSNGTTSTSTTSSTTSSTAPAPSGAWVDDALPAGAVGSGSGGDTWNWITSGPAPFSGTKAHQSALAAGLHEHSFNWASTTMAVQTGDTLHAYIYLDPANPPSEIMISWLADNWEHRAYWGANQINYGKDGTNSRRKVGNLPAAGQWIRLEVPASQVGLEGLTVKGMSFALYGGRATWDAAGRAPAGSIATATSTTSTGVSTVTIAATDANAVIGTSDYASFTFTRAGGDTSSALKTKFALGGTAVKWIDYRRPEGDMPVEISIPAGATSAVMNLRALANSTNANPQTVTVTLANDAAYTVGAAKSAIATITAVGQAVPVASTDSTTTNTSTDSGSTTTAPTVPSTAWVDDALPAGAKGSGTNGDAWNWITTGPTPGSGSKAHQSNLAAGLHEHSFNWATATMSVATGDVLYAYIYLDPANPPSEVMLSWLSDNWEHRAYWGANQISYGKDGTNSRRKVGDLPAAGQWVRLEVPASQVGLEGHTVKGMSFALYGGRATWDAAGTAPAGTLATQSASSGPATITLAATDASAVINSTNFGAFTFTRTGDTSAALKVKFAYSGTAVKWLDYRRPEGDIPVEFTIPAGAATATMNIKAIANVTNSNPQTIVATLATDAGYTIGSQKTGTITVSPPGTVVADGPEVTTSTDSTGTGSTGSTDSGSTGSDTSVTDSTGTTGSVAGAAAPPMSVVDYTLLAIPSAGSSTLHVLSPTTLELVRINTAATGAVVDSWSFVDSTGTFTAPANNRFTVTVNGQAVAVQSVGFKRRPLYAPLVNRDLRVINSLVLQLAAPVAEGQTVEVKNPDGDLWPSSMEFKAAAHPLRYSPAVHVNQEGYVPGLPKKAQVGYYLGNLGEMTVPTPTFALVNAATGATVHSGSLRLRADSGWVYSPAPYQKVYEADFSSFAMPGEYRLVVPGLGASLPFRINDGVALGFARTYAQGLYHQRCGHANVLPFTRHTHEACHLEAAFVPVPATNFPFTWTTISADASKVNKSNPTQTAPLLTSEANQLFPYVNKGTRDVSGGHHDAGDYSKYTINSASLVHTLVFAVDSLSGVAALDNLGLPESGDGVSDVLQEAKIEADFLAKLQDADGGFYFLVYPRDRRYESNVLPDRGDPQVVWPKNTSATAAAVAALAEAASSPRFKAAYPQAAADYLAKAKLGWQFLTDAIAKHGKAGAYQKLTHYGDDFTHDDELAWAAAAMFVATGDTGIHATLKSWFDPASPSTWRWGWWHGYMSYGNAVRTYAFAARSGRLPAAQLDSGYLTKCEAEVRTAANDAVKWSGMSAYGTSFPDASKRQMSAGWYFSAAQAFDLAVGRQLDARADYLDAMLANLNYEAGSNGVNVTFVTGLGWKRQKEIVHQYAQNDDRALPPNGIPLGGLQTGPAYTATYGTDLAALTFPRDNATTAPHGFYDRWSDTFNVVTEFVHLDQARSLAASAYLATLTPAKAQPWRSGSATITGIPAQPAVGTPVTVSLAVSGLDLAGARIIWEAKGQAPAYGPTYTFTPGGYGSQWVEAEAQWPDGRRVVAREVLFAENGLPTVSVTATDATATLGSTTDTATWTFTRAGSTTDAIKVPFKFSGTAAKWTDYRRPEGDLPAEITIPAGATTVTYTIKAIANSTNADPQTVVLTLSSGSGFNIGTPYSATVTIK